MLTVSVWEKLAQFGMEGIIFGGFLLVLRWVFDVNHKILTSMDVEREKYQESLKGFNENIKENSVNAKAFYAEVKESHDATRKQHEEMMIILGRINGYKH